MLLGTCCTFLAIAIASGFEIDEEKTAMFDVKPGGMLQEHSIDLDGVKCKFIYACQGGTNEEWKFSIARAEDHSEYFCKVARPGGTSYLFFQQFTFKVKGVFIEEAYGESQSGEYLSEEEYAIDKRKNTVSHVEGKFKSQLASLEVFGVKKREEL